MKLLAASDIHGDINAVEKLAKRAKDEKVDLVILAGDLSIFGDGLEGLLKPFKDAKKKVALIPGNHDSEADIFLLKQRYPDMLYDMHSYAFRIGDVGFFGCGLANIGPNELSEYEIKKRIEDAQSNVQSLREERQQLEERTELAERDHVFSGSHIHSTGVAH